MPPHPNERPSPRWDANEMQVWTLRQCLPGKFRSAPWTLTKDFFAQVSMLVNFTIFIILRQQNYFVFSCMFWGKICHLSYKFNPQSLGWIKSSDTQRDVNFPFRRRMHFRNGIGSSCSHRSDFVAPVLQQEDAGFRCCRDLLLPRGTVVDTKPSTVGRGK